VSQLLYHCFPGFLSESRRDLGRDPTFLEQMRSQIGYLTLKSILEAGLMLTPETFYIPEPDRLHEMVFPNSDLNGEGRGSFRMQQVRACFTLASLSELKRQITSLSHFDLFGAYAIGLDPIEARDLGVIPTIYYYLDDRRVSNSLYFEIISRLIEARKLLISLAHIESLADSDCWDTPTIEELRGMGQTLDGEPDSVIHAASNLSEDLAKRIYPLFDTRRVPIANIVEHIEIFFNFFQIADSQTRDRPLAYFQQKEWRIVQYNKEGLTCEPLSGMEYSHSLAWREVRNLHLYWDVINNILGAHGLETRKITDNFWLLVNLGDRRFRDFIKHIIVPDSALESTQELISGIYFQNSAPIVISHSQIEGE
jgi:hypothetical protein